MPNSQAPFEAFFLPVAGATPGQRFCVFHAAKGNMVRGSVLFVHPFAEEMNKSRRMAALQSRALAQAGFNVLQIDLHGCGDSSGDFGEASWPSWLDDVMRGIKWLQMRSNASLWLWGLRAGCLLVAEAARRNSIAANFLFWAPTPNGKQVLQQFLRLKVASSLTSGSAKGTMDSMRSDLAMGKQVDIAGYQLAPALASGLDQSTLDAPTTQAAGYHLKWFEISTRSDAAINPIGAKCFEGWSKAGLASVHCQVIQGPAFWQTSEVEEVSALIETSTQAVIMAIQP